MFRSSFFNDSKSFPVSRVQRSQETRVLVSIRNIWEYFFENFAVNVFDSQSKIDKESKGSQKYYGRNAFFTFVNPDFFPNICVNP